MTTPSHPTDTPTPEAREAARSALLEIGCCLYGRPSPTTEIARALDAFAAAKVEREREKIDTELVELRKLICTALSAARAQGRAEGAREMRERVLKRIADFGSGHAVTIAAAIRSLPESDL